MKKYSELASLFFSIYLTYIFCGSFCLFFFVGAQTTIALAVIGLPFFILSIIYDNYDTTPKHRGYGWIYLSPAQNSEEKLLIEYYHEYTQLFTTLMQPPTPLVNISHILTLTQPYQSADEATWSHYAELVVAQQKGN